MENDICKIINKNNEQYTGFICKIPYPDINNMIKVLITYNNIINEEINKKFRFFFRSWLNGYQPYDSFLFIFHKGIQ